MTATGPNVVDLETRRAHMHQMWAGVAGEWAARADEVDARGVAVTAAMLARTAPQPGERVLELACGPGGAGLAAAERVGASGEVVVSDVVSEMAATAASRAAARGLTNVRATTLDLEDIDEPDESFDIVICREGLMFAVEPERATREIHRVLRPSGRVAIAVWGPQRDNPWLGVVFDAISAQTGVPIPPPGLPGPFALDDADRLRAMLTGAGFVDVGFDEISSPLRSPSFDAWWTRTRAVAGPIATIVAALPDPAKDALETRLRAAVDPYTTPEGVVELPGLSLLASAHRAL